MDKATKKRLEELAKGCIDVVYNENMIILIKSKKRYRIKVKNQKELNNALDVIFKEKEEYLKCLNKNLKVKKHSRIKEGGNNEV